MQRQGRKHTHARPHTTPKGPRACGGEHTVAGTLAADGQVAVAPAKDDVLTYLRQAQWWHTVWCDVYVVCSLAACIVP